MVKRVYAKATSDEMADMIITKISENLGEDSSKLSMKDAISNPLYKRATIVNIGYVFFHEVAAINVINYYSNQIFKESEQGGSSFTPRLGTLFVGVA